MNTFASQVNTAKARRNTKSSETRGSESTSRADLVFHDMRHLGSHAKKEYLELLRHTSIFLMAPLSKGKSKAG